MPQPPIAHYHAHIYYDPANSRGRAERLRQQVAKNFPQAKLGSAGTTSRSDRIRNRCFKLLFPPRCLPRLCRG